MTAPLVEPWSPEKRESVQKKIDKEAARTAKRLGAECCVVIAFFDGGQYLHRLEGGQSPMPLDELYRQLAEVREALKERGVPDVVEEKSGPIN